VVLELTESIFVGDVGPQRAELDRLWRFGFRISVDDFGTGYSSLRYLEQLPIHEIKIDRSFVDGIDRSQTKQSVTARIVELASDLGLTTVAEGIEGAAELEIVRRLGCDYGQGYYFSQPVNAATFESLLGLRATSSTNRRRALPAKS
jgi:EAL domain-containing protein (putative c-di-GMP-specific phosphodiesterase class I)